MPPASLAPGAGAGADGELEAIRQDLEARRRARLREVGVAEAFADSSELRAPASSRRSDDGLLRVMQFNILAEGLADDGFLVTPVLERWPTGDHGTLPTSDGSPPVAFAQLLRDIEGARGDADALAAIRARHQVPDIARNLQAVVDVQARDLQLQLAILAAGRPDVIVMQELDRFGRLSRALKKLGYASQLPGKTGPYEPPHLQGHGGGRCGDAVAARFREHLLEAGHTFLPKPGSSALKLHLQHRGLTEGLVAAAEARGLADHIARRSLEGVPGGSVPLLLDAGLADPAEVDDDGVAVFWREDRLEATAMRVHFAASGLGVLEVRLRCKATARSLIVLGAHLRSGGRPADEAWRLREQVCCPDGLAPLLRSIREEAASCPAQTGEGAAPQRPALFLALDANAHPQPLAPPRPGDDGGEGAEDAPPRSVWRALREAAGASVWDGFFDPSGAELPAAASSAAGEPGPLEAPVTSNKLRGTETAQARKMGEHGYVCIDHVFFDPAALRLARHVAEPRRFSSRLAALEDLQPSLANPSDHFPVVVDLAWVAE